MTTNSPGATRRRWLLSSVGTSLGAALGLAACAGYRGGWESVAYIGTPPDWIRSDDANAPSRPNPLDLPGLQLQVRLDNQLRTRDTQVMLFAVPIAVDPRDVFVQNHQPGKTRVFVSVRVDETGFVFRPTLAVLSVAGRRVSGEAGFDFARWDAQGRRLEPGDTTAGQWLHRPVGEAFALDEQYRRYLLSIDFLLPAPSPQTPDIELDLSQALKSPTQPALPPIRFAPVRWREGYT